MTHLRVQVLASRSFFALPKRATTATSHGKRLHSSTPARTAQRDCKDGKCDARFRYIVCWRHLVETDFLEAQTTERVQVPLASSF